MRASIASYTRPCRPAVLAILLLLGVAAPAEASREESAYQGLRVEPARTIRSLSLIDEQGRARDFPLRTDKWQLVMFGYTHCTDVCPVTLHRVALLLRQLDEEAKRLQPVFISIDADRDTPEAMRGFLRQGDARILGLTGKPQALQAVAGEFDVVVRRFRGRSALAYTLEHSSFLYLLDPQGRVRMLYPASSDAAGIARDLHRLWGMW
jgi:protein SCO1/2